MQWDYDSFELQDLINRMLSVGPDEHPSILEILEWDWIRINNINATQRSMKKWRKERNLYYISKNSWIHILQLKYFSWKQFSMEVNYCRGWKILEKL